MIAKGGNTQETYTLFTYECQVRGKRGLGYDLPHGMIGTVLIALAGEPLTIFELTAR
jgi:hypothetical protein